MVSNHHQPRAQLHLHCCATFFGNHRHISQLNLLRNEQSSGHSDVHELVARERIHLQRRLLKTLAESMQRDTPPIGNIHIRIVLRPYSHAGHRTMLQDGCQDVLPDLSLAPMMEHKIIPTNHPQDGGMLCHPDDNRSNVC